MMLESTNPLPHLPSYTGPHTVGSMVYEISLSSLEEQIATSGRLLGLTTIKFRLFYPTKAPATSATCIPWVPEPQSLHLDAYLKLAKLSPWLRTLISAILPYYLSHATIPAVANAPFLPGHTPRRVLIFSHGLIGNMNSHSALLGELASHGFVCVATEHRDGSGPLSIINSTSPADQLAPTELTSIPFERISHLACPDVYEKRDRQLQLRMFELSATFSALLALNSSTRPADILSNFSPNSLNLFPGNVAWAGHSFGGATVINFVKSIYHHQPNSPSTLLTTTTLRDQITPYSPLILLDPWFFPLRSPTFSYLLDLPLPCHSQHLRHNNPPSGCSATTLSIHSTEYAYCWPQFQSHPTKILSPTPTEVPMDTDEEAMNEMMQYKSREDYIDQARRRHYESLDGSLSLDFDLNLSGGEGEEEEDDDDDDDQEGGDSHAHASPEAPRNEDQQQLPNPKPTQHDTTSPVQVVVLPHTSHPTFSDIGLLFPYLSYWYFAQWDAEAALGECVQSVLGVLRP